MGVAAQRDHFLTDDQWSAVAHLHPPAFARQIRIVRALVGRSDVIVTPSSEMAQRVISVLPKVSDRIVVRFHPFRASAVPRGERSPLILCPITKSPFKRLDSSLLDLQAALPPVDGLRVVCTMDAATMPDGLRTDPRFDFVGVVERSTLAELYSQARGVYYPTEVESFGYPLAEARAMGLNVIAQDTGRTREIAGAALSGFDAGSADSLSAAVHDALTSTPEPDPTPFDPTAYFDWLLG